MSDREYQSAFSKGAPVCSVVEDRECKFPANFDPKPGARITTCYACGNDVCTAEFCSRRVPYLGDKRRLCAWCIEQHTGKSIEQMIHTETSADS